MEQKNNLKSKERNISGSSTGMGFGRGGTPKDVAYVQEQGEICGSSAAVGFGRGGSSKRYILER